MNPTPLISVLIANYNNGIYLSECIESIFNQTYTNWEIIFIDDCSTDDSIKIIEHYKEQDKRLSTFYLKKNKGCGYAKRMAANYANGRYCVFVDPDDTITLDALENILKFAKENPNFAMYQADFIYCNEFLRPQKISDLSRYIPVGENYLTSWPENHISALCLYDNEMYKKTKGINPKLPKAVDKDLYFKLEEIAPSIYCEGKALYNYRIHNRGISKLNNWHPANYWTIKTMRDAYLRRKKSRNTDVKNISKEELSNITTYWYTRLIFNSLKNKNYIYTFKGLSALCFAMRIDKFIVLVLKLTYSFFKPTTSI